MPTPQKRTRERPYHTPPSIKRPRPIPLITESDTDNEEDLIVVQVKPSRSHRAVRPTHSRIPIVEIPRRPTIFKGTSTNPSLRPKDFTQDIKPEPTSSLNMSNPSSGQASTPRGSSLTGKAQVATQSVVESLGIRSEHGILELLKHSRAITDILQADLKLQVKELQAANASLIVKDNNTSTENRRLHDVDKRNQQLSQQISTLNEQMQAQKRLSKQALEQARAKTNLAEEQLKTAEEKLARYRRIYSELGAVEQQ